VSEIALICWDRLSSAPSLQSSVADSGHPSLDSQTRCLWCGGFIANRSDLIQQTGLLEGTPDCQLLLHLYRRYGGYAAQHIAGPFAWILWDSDRHELVVARDRIGSQGLYYTVHGETVLITNRVELLLDALPSSPVFNPRSVIAQINALAPLAGETFYENIHAIEPGGLLTITRNGIESSHYWRVEPQPTLKLASDAEYAEAFRGLLCQVVAGYISPGRIGVTLSSGLDSTSVAAAIRIVAPAADLTAFCLITPELPEADESWYSSAVCSHLNLPAVTIRADLHWTLCASGGIKTSAATPFYNYYTELWDATFREIRQHGVNVVFSGISGDHLFGGNVFAYPDLLLTCRWLELARQIRTHLSQPERKMNLVQVTRRMVLGPVAHSYLPRLRKISKDPVPWLRTEYHGLYQECLVRSDKSYRMLPGRQQRLRTLRDPLLPRIIEQANLQAAEHSIEFRHPLLDHRLIEFAASLPTTQTFRAAQRKIIMRNAMRGYLPDGVLNMRGKIYPTAIARRGLREREQAKVWALMTDMRAAELGFVDEKRLQEAYRAYLADKQQSALFWYTLTLEDWLRRYF
jgi:asparagine synthase (glutamine-hydrolysing)